MIYTVRAFYAYIVQLYMRCMNISFVHNILGTWATLEASPCGATPSPSLGQLGKFTGG